MRVQICHLRQDTLHKHPQPKNEGEKNYRLSLQ